MKKLVPLVAVVALSATAFAAGPASAATVRQCHTRVYANGPVYVTSTRGMLCPTAAKEQKRYRWTGKNKFRTPTGFVCTPSGRGKVGYQIRCVRGNRAYRIEFAD